MADDHNKRTPAASKLFDTVRHKLGANTFPLMGRKDRHRAECRTEHRPDGHRAEHDVTHHRAIGYGHERKDGGSAVTQRIDDSTFLLLTEGLPIYFANGLHISRLFVSDFDQFVLGLSAERSK